MRSTSERIDQLIAVVLDRRQALSEEEAIELQHLLDRDPDQWIRYQQTLDTEILLRSFSETLDVEDNVMTAIRKQTESRRLVLFPRQLKMRLVITTTAAAMAAIALVLFSGKQVSPEVASLRGSAQVERAGTILDLAAVSQLAAGDLLTLESNALAELQFPDQTSVTLFGETQLAFLPHGKAIGFDLKTGRISAEVKPQKDPMTIITRDGEVIVRGTRFLVETGADATLLSVESGEVEFQKDTLDPITVLTGEKIVVQADDPQFRPARSEPEPLLRYTFQAGRGKLVRNRSIHEEFAESFHLQLSESAAGLNWVDRGVELDGHQFLVSDSLTDPLIARFEESGEFTIEAWITPSQSLQGGPARIVSFSQGSSHANAYIAQGNYQVAAANGFVARFPSRNGKPLETSSSPPQLTHLIYSRSDNGQERLYVDGIEKASHQTNESPVQWPSGLPLTLGGDLGGDTEGESRNWKGVFHFVAIFDTALSEVEVVQNFDAGPWQPVQP